MGVRRWRFGSWLAVAAVLIAVLAAVGVGVLVKLGTAVGQGDELAAPLMSPMRELPRPGAAVAPPAAPAATHRRALLRTADPRRRPPGPAAHSRSAAHRRAPRATATPTRSAPPVAQPVRVDAPSTEPVAGTPCTVSARACVDLAAGTSWLIENGKIVRGPVAVSTGDTADPTPRGTFQVQLKAQNYTSREFLTPMPYSVFFADGGIAFHEGRQDTNSAGCVKLTHADAIAWFDFLQIGDEVQIR